MQSDACRPDPGPEHFGLKAWGHEDVSVRGADSPRVLLVASMEAEPAHAARLCSPLPRPTGPHR